MHAHHFLGFRVYPYILGFIALEIACYLLWRKRAYPWREMLASLAIYALRIPEKLLKPLSLAPLILFLWSHRLTTIPLNTPWGLALLFLAVDFAYYWMHRADHEIRWMWATHSVHHTSAHIHFASAFRLGVTGLLSGNWLFHLPLYLLGFHPFAVGAMFAINLLYQFWLHTDLVGRLGPLEWILNTPSHHRAHHASNPEYLDKNYGGMLIVWDRLFGSFAAETPEAKLVYGLVHPIGSLNPLKLLFHEWLAMVRDVARARSVREALRLLFGRPGAVVMMPATRAAAPILTAGAD